MTKTLSRIVLAAAAVAVLGGCARFPLGPMIDQRTDPGAPKPGDTPRGPNPR